MIKVTILLVRNPALSPKAFVQHHKEKHAALFMSVPVVQETVRRYVQQHSLRLELPGLPPEKYDGITELWFDDVESFGRCFSDPEYMRVVRPDETSFLDLERCDFVISAEHTVLA
jgi:uncharacterized protein (TIGR02118 family)